jgi:hypothetical protein
MGTSLGKFHQKGGDDVPVIDGGTGSSTAPAALAALGHATTSHLGIPGAGKLVQQVRSTDATIIACPTAIPFDNTIPQNAEGDQVIAATITPLSLSHFLLIEFSCSGSSNVQGNAIPIAALFRDADPNALAARFHLDNMFQQPLYLYHVLPVTSLAVQTYRIRVGVGVSPATYFVNADRLGAAVLGGADQAILTVSEIAL